MATATGKRTGGGAITVRPATIADVPSMAMIELVAFSDPWPASAFAELLPMAHSRIAVAVDASGLLLGYCVLLSAADEGEIANIAVLPAARGRGIGARLLDETVAAATEAGVSQLFLEVRTSNDAARGLYASRGFVPVGRRIAYYREPLEDALVLRRQAEN